MKIIKQFPYAAYLQLCIDEACKHGTPQIVISQGAMEYLELDTPVLNISGSAVRNFSLSDSWISFDCTRGGEPLHVNLHPSQVHGVNVREAEGWCFFPNIGAQAKFVCKTEAGEQHLKEYQRSLVESLEKMEQKEPPIEEVKEATPKGDNVVSLFDRRKK